LTVRKQSVAKFRFKLDLAVLLSSVARCPCLLHCCIIGQINDDELKQSGTVWLKYCIIDTTTTISR